MTLLKLSPNAEPVCEHLATHFPGLELEAQGETLSEDLVEWFVWSSEVGLLAVFQRYIRSSIHCK